ncbi:MAG TPA: TetR/AcrR family transcriptional regulator [Caulobacteraceae bacterium]
MGGISEQVETDGRRRRSQDSRARIVAAMLELVNAGEYSPAAELVAARAGVGLRTVFRHFTDMDSLYREMSEVIEAELRAVVETPFEAATPRGRVLELVRRRAWAYEKIGQFKRSTAANRHRSRFLEADQARFVEIAREILRRQAPPEVVKDKLKFEALDALLSFEAWDRLRTHQRLTPRRATEVLEFAVEKVLD